MTDEFASGSVGTIADPQYITEPLRPLKYVSIMTTSACTSACVYCPHPYSWATKNPGYMKDELFEKIIKDISETYPNFSGYYSFQNGNEPTADPRFIERIKLIYKYLPHIKLNFPTNAQLLTPEKGQELIDLFYDNGPGQLEDTEMRILIHFSGINKKSWQKLMRPKQKYEETVENIRALLTYNNQKGRELERARKDRLAYVHQGVTGEQTSHFNKMKAPHAIHIGIGGFTASHGKEVEYYTTREWQEHIDELFGDYGGFMTAAWAFQNRAGDLRLFDEFPLGNAPERKIDKDNPFKCARFFDGKALHVLYNGQVTICCNDWQRRTAIGDLNKQTVTEFFNSDEYKTLMGKGHGYIESDPKFICKLCRDFQAIEDLPD